MAETDYFARAVTERLPASLGNQRIGDVLNLSDYGPEVRDRLKSMTVRQLLPVNLGAAAVRAGNPRARVVLGGLASDVEFLRELFDEHGAEPHVDVVNLHSYYET